ncbi:TetR/AcrR family transcriptional regulator [candidate division WOR-3 bacterium]|nr:TetR/AcrR family transcriptional regulator [candidate division WOR-3 bacterium]
MDLDLRKSKEREERKKAIIKAAVRIFSSKGFVHTTVSDIAQEAGFSKSALYFYFRKKEDIIREILKSIIADFRNLIGEIELEDLPFFDKIEKMFNAILNYVEFNKEIITILYSEAHNLYSSKEKKFREFLEKYRGFVLNAIKTLICQGIKDGDIKDCDAELLSNVLRGMLASLVFYRIEGGILSNKECVEFILDTLRKGMECVKNNSL